MKETDFSDWDTLWIRLRELIPDYQIPIGRQAGPDSIVAWCNQNKIPAKYIYLADIAFPGLQWHFVESSFTDSDILEMMFPTIVRKRLSGRVIIKNGHLGHKIDRPMIIDFSTLDQFCAGYTNEIGDLFDRDVLFVFVDIKVISIFHHEGAFCHLYF